ncbi:MAG: DsbC family protein [Proteobacteria bacterium]|nr:DsbC family protein [Pseudomonadota bacterium]
MRRSPFPTARLIALSTALALTFPAAADAPDPKASALAALLQAKYPAAQFKEARPSPIVGIYEVVTSRGQIGYVDASGRFAIFGSMYDMENNVDLGAKRKVELAPKVDWASLPLEKAFKIVKGDGSRRLAVFTDPDCPYCKKLEESLASVDNVTIHMFLMPIAQLHPDAKAKAESVWCSPDRALAWQRLITQGEVAAAKCETPIEDIAALAKKLEIFGTPGLILPSGRIHAGWLPAEQLAQALTQ